uniref:Uncharacterized protein n=1 Tax=Strigamia maritima TaxID=126957 RepID=T1J8F9_STRMM
MKMYSAALLIFTVGTATGLLLPPVSNVLNQLTNSSDEIIQAVAAPILNTANTGCSPNPDCSQYVRTGLVAVVEILQELKYYVNDSDAITPLDRHNITLTPEYNITLTKDICSKHINSTTRRDSGQLQFDNFKNEMFIDLRSATTQVLNVEKTIQNVLGDIPCLKTVPHVTGAVSTDFSIAQCIPNSISLDANLTGYFSVVVTGLRVDVDYTAHDNSRWIVNSAQYSNGDLENIQSKNKTCIGSPAFIEVCECFLASDFFTKSLYFATDATYTCLFQQLLDLDATELGKCPYF